MKATVFAALVLGGGLLVTGQRPASIHQSGYEAFSKGRLGNSGANLYVSRRGQLQVINKWDLNGDGYNDVLISNDHNLYETVDAFVYWNSGKGFTSLLPDLWREAPLAQTVFGLMDQPAGLTRLPAFGGGRSIIADLNRDGYPDIVFCNYIHNYPGNRSAFIYWGGPDGYRRDRRTELPTIWAAGVAAADLNGDGYPDLVFANQGSEAGAENLSPDEGRDSYIYWGGPTGFDPAHPAHIPTQGARDVAIADVNHDGYPDLAFINNSPVAQNLQVFLGGSGGYSAERTQTIPLTDPSSIRAGDVNGDGYQDLLIATAAKPTSIGYASPGVRSTHTVYVFPGSAGGVSANRVIELPSLEARDIAVADLNRDGFADVVIANGSDGASSKTSSYIYWGSAAGLDVKHRSELPTIGARGVAVADFNGDGYPDLVFANSHDDRSYDVPSYIYWGSPQGYAPYLRSQVQSFGAASVAAADLNGDGRPEIVLVNQYSGDYGEIDTNIFWGNPHHYYSTASMTGLPGLATYGTTAADLNDDGYVDLVMCSAAGPARIYWGSKDGFSAANRTMLPVTTAYTSSAEDLNRDGYLDLVFAGHVDGRPAATILWGAANGYDAARKQVLPLILQRSPSHVVADLNHDGYLDLIFVDSYFTPMQIFWGSAEGYSTARSWTGDLPNGGNLELADLNGDGRLDFVVAGMFDPKIRSYNTHTHIYWGSPDGTPSLKDSIELESFGSVECAIADLNRDGYLDLVISSYMSDSTRSLPVFIYWGGPGGTYSNSHRTLLPAESSAGVQTLDLNGDGYPEIIVHNHLRDGRHTGHSYIYWNGPKGFDAANRTELPTFGPHYSQRVDPGNLYDRKLEEEYVSAPLFIPNGRRPAQLSWKSEEPHGAKIEFQVRSAAGPESLARAQWEGQRGPGSFYSQPGAELAGMDGGDRWIQYRAVFRSPDAGAWPTLSAVDISLR